MMMPRARVSRRFSGFMSGYRPMIAVIAIVIVSLAMIALIFTLRAAR
jgi:hypothetical protein